MTVSKAGHHYKAAISRRLTIPKVLANPFPLHMQGMSLAF